VRLGGWTLWHMTVIQAIRRLREEDPKWGQIGYTEWVCDQHRLHSKILSRTGWTWGHNSVMDHLPTMDKTLSLIPNTWGKRKTKTCGTSKDRYTDQCNRIQSSEKILYSKSQQDWGYGSTSRCLPSKHETPLKKIHKK
jgi:hypothetical protein